MTEFRGVDDRKSENDRKDEGDRKSRYERNDRGGSRWSIWSGHVSGRSRIVFFGQSGRMASWRVRYYGTWWNIVERYVQELQFKTEMVIYKKMEMKS